MQRISSVIGKSFLSQETGEKLGKVQDALVNVDERRVLGFIVKEGGIFSSGRIVHMQDVRAIGPDAIMVDSSDVVDGLTEERELARAASASEHIKGVRLVTEDGRDLGTIADLEFEPVTGHVTGYVVTGGAISDMYSGASVLPVEHVLSIGKSVAIVSPEAVELLERQEGGIKSMVKDAATAAGPALSSMKEKIGESASHLGSKKEEARSVMQELRQRVMGFLEDRRIRLALGRTVNRVILDRQDQPILNPGDIITHESIERARGEDALDMLLASVQYPPKMRLADLAT